MNRIEQVAIEHDCAKLVYSYCQTIDVYDYDAFVQLWADDAVWETRAGVCKGHAEIRKYLDSRAQGVTGRHHCTNVVVDVVDANTARGRSYFMYFVGAPGTKTDPVIGSGPAVVGEYVDQFRLTSKGWKFAHRGTVITMSAPPK